MKASLVLDANAAVKLFVEEEESSAMRAVRDLHVRVAERASEVLRELGVKWSS